MKRISLLGFFLIAIIGCDKDNDEIRHLYSAKIVDFDLNCSTCILSFPDDSLALKTILGKSPNNFYQTVNLNRNEFIIGQKIKVNVRKANESELKACKTLYPSNNYTKIYISKYESYQNFSFNDTIDLKYGDCLNNFKNQVIICLDSVISDSRCPNGAICFWEGNAEVRFKLEKYNETPVLISLNTNRKYQTDTLILGLRLFLIGLKPYPEIFNEIRQEDYQAEIRIINE